MVTLNRFFPRKILTMAKGSPTGLNESKSKIFENKNCIKIKVISVNAPLSLDFSTAIFYLKLVNSIYD